MHLVAMHAGVVNLWEAGGTHIRSGGCTDDHMKAFLRCSMLQQARSCFLARIWRAAARVQLVVGECALC